MMAQKKKKEKVIATGKAPAPSKAPKETIAATKGTIREGKKTTPSRGPLAAERVNAILKALDEAYPEAVCALHHRTPWELLVATILSAQCTDVRVNMVTPELFRRFPTPAAMAKASLPELEELIRTTGFFRNKAKSIQGAARKIIAEFGGEVPQTLAELITVPGAARKTANVVLGVWFGKAEGVVVDTHVFRIARRLELAKGDTPRKGRAGTDADSAARPLDQLFAPDHPSRPPGVRRAQSQMQSVQSGAAVPVKRQDVGVREEAASQRVSKSATACNRGLGWS